MDIFSHGLWTGAAAELLNRTKFKMRPRKLHVIWTAFWGVFPDLFAFGLPMSVIIVRSLFGLPNQYTPDPVDFEPAGDPAALFRGSSSAAEIFFSRLPAFFYHVSHSIFVFAAIFGLVWLLCKRPVWEMGGWLFHILIDIPTHSYRFYPTPFLWPLSGFKFNSFSWAEPWFLVPNYIAILIVYLLLRALRRRRSEPPRV